jgi:hypothetical protein
MIDEVSKEALATLIVSVAKMVAQTQDTSMEASLNEATTVRTG